VRCYKLKRYVDNTGPHFNQALNEQKKLQCLFELNKELWEEMMNCKTTACISLQYSAILEESAQTSGIPLRSIIVYMIMYAASKEKGSIKHLNIEHTANAMLLIPENGIHCLKFYCEPPPMLMDIKY